MVGTYIYLNKCKKKKNVREVNKKQNSKEFRREVGELTKTLPLNTVMFHRLVTLILTFNRTRVFKIISPFAFSTVHYVFFY